ncbi:MAG: hypothetical protein JWQ31_2860 [Mycobacterium sp.]|jgi:hypothetical protein|nr:hypothetical protein [Mycobacterium sp.]
MNVADIPAALARYEAARRPHTAKVQRMSWDDNTFYHVPDAHWTRWSTCSESLALFWPYRFGVQRWGPQNRSPCRQEWLTSVRDSAANATRSMINAPRELGAPKLSAPPCRQLVRLRLSVPVESCATRTGWCPLVDATQADSERFVWCRIDMCVGVPPVAER